MLLWHDYRRSGNPRSLETLLAYNIQDVVNLETLLVMAYNLKIRPRPSPNEPAADTGRSGASLQGGPGRRLPACGATTPGSGLSGDARSP